LYDLMKAHEEDNISRCVEFALKYSLLDSLTFGVVIEHEFTMGFVMKLKLFSLLFFLSHQYLQCWIFLLSRQIKLRFEVLMLSAAASSLVLANKQSVISTCWVNSSVLCSILSLENLERIAVCFSSEASKKCG